MFYCKFKTISYSLLLSKFEFDVPLSLLPKEFVALYPQCEAVVLWGWWKGAKAWECKLSRGGGGEGKRRASKTRENQWDRQSIHRCQFKVSFVSRIVPP